MPKSANSLAFNNILADALAALFSIVAKFEPATQLRTLITRNAISALARKMVCLRSARFPQCYGVAGLRNSSTSPPFRNWSR